MQLVEPAALGVGRAVSRVAAVDRRVVLAAITLVSWAVTAGFALHVAHNGWLYYSGGDGTYYFATPWALAHHILPETVISYGLPVFFWPVPLVFGSSLLSSLPVVVLVQVIVGPPLAVVGMYGIGRRIGNELFGYVCALVWALSPFLAYHYFYPRIRHDWGATVLPGVLGLNNLGDYASLVLTIVVAWLTLRAIDERRWNDVLLAGLLCGFLIAVKPANGFFVPAPICALLVARLWREALGFVGAMIPALVTLALWKSAGLGHLPLFGATAVRVAAGPTAALGIDTGHYITFRWSNFTTNLAQIREYGWSLRMAEWVPVAGFVGVLRRGLPHAVLLGLWCVDYLVIKGGTGGATVYSMAFFRLTEPGFPAYVLLACCTVFLVPGLGRRWAPRVVAAVRPYRTRGLIAAVAVLAVYPLAVVLAHGGPAGNRVAIDNSNNTVPVTSDLHVHVVQTPAGPSIRWSQPGTAGSKVAFAVYRGRDTGCPEPNPTHECHFTMPFLRLVHALNFPAWQVGPGIYRIGLVAGPRIHAHDSDLLLLSPAIRVR